MLSLPTNCQDSAPQFRLDPEHYLIQMMHGALKRIQLRELNIQLCGDRVTLTGSVNCWSDKQFAQESIREVSGSRVIQNELNVAPGM